MPKIGDIFSGKDLGRKGCRYIVVRCPDCPEGQDTRLAPYSTNPRQITSVRFCPRHNARRQGAAFSARMKS